MKYANEPIDLAAMPSALLSRRLRGSVQEPERSHKV